MPASSHKRNRSASAARLRIALAQINVTVGDFRGNTEKIRDALHRARSAGAGLVLFPELAVTGYPPEDLLLKPDFVRENLNALRSLAPFTRDIAAIVGYAERDRGALYNSAAVFANGKLIGSCRKLRLPNYGVFDEKRWFRVGDRPTLLLLNGIRLGLGICEDIWDESGPAQILARHGMDILINISCSPFHAGKGKQRRELIRRRARQYRSAVAYVNLVGAQDELVFDGRSLVAAPAGRIIAEGRCFEEDLVLADLDIPRATKTRRRTGGKKIRILRAGLAPRAALPPLPRAAVRQLHGIEEIHVALVLGTRDYIRKNGFRAVTLGLSGGVDSAVTAAIAAEALGPEHVTGVLMPSPYSSPGSIADAEELARNLGIKTLTLPISDIMQACEKTLAGPFGGAPPGLAEENLQARIRGNLLMALSNKFGWLVLTTGNKSEVSVGYCTLYGDMAGGLAVIKDVPKTRIYELARHINYRAGGKGIIPEATLTKEPSAELRPNQKDTDSLPPYPVLDPLLQKYVEEDVGVEELIRKGNTRELVRRVARMVDTSEYKRRQGPPGIKITPKAFGRDRRLPITNRYEPLEEKLKVRPWTPRDRDG